jgi:hypothetical protein
LKLVQGFRILMRDVVPRVRAMGVCTEEREDERVPFEILHGWIRSGVAGLQEILREPTLESVADRLRDRSVSSILGAITAADEGGPAAIGGALLSCDPAKARLAHLGRSTLRIAEIVEKFLEKPTSPVELGRRLRPALRGRVVADVHDAVAGGEVVPVVVALVCTAEGIWSDAETAVVAEYLVADPVRSARLVAQLRTRAPSPVIPTLDAAEAAQLAAALADLSGDVRGQVIAELLRLDDRCGREIDWEGLSRRISRIRRRDEDRVQSVFAAFAQHLDNGRFDAVFPDRESIVHYVLRIARNKEAKLRQREAKEEERRKVGRGRPLEQQNAVVDFGSGQREYDHSDSGPGVSSDVWSLEIEQRLAWALRGWTWVEPNQVRRDPRTIVLGLLAEMTISDAAKNAVGRAAGCSSRNVDKHWFRFAGEFLAGLRGGTGCLYDAVVGGRRRREVVEAIVTCGRWDATDLAQRAGYPSEMVTEVRRNLSEHLHGVLRRAHLRTPWDDASGDEEGEVAGA